MSTFVSSLPESSAGLAAALLNLIIAFGLITVSLALGVAISLLIGLPVLVTEPQRAIRARGNRGTAE
jgi:hypothetical protein